MLVYRICYKEEVNTILETQDFNSIGKTGLVYRKRQEDNDTNTHNYQEQEKYLHFFKDKGSICYMNTHPRRCICTYDIPEEVLNKSVGVGKYWEYIEFRYLVNVEEYAINIKDLKPDYLIQVDEIIDYIDAEDYLYDHPLDGLIKNIYKKEKPKIKRLPDR